MLYTEKLKNVCPNCGHKLIETYFTTKKSNWNCKKYSNFNKIITH
jgi:hypothetical protein